MWKGYSANPSIYVGNKPPILKYLRGNFFLMVVLLWNEVMLPTPPQYCDLINHIKESALPLLLSAMSASRAAKQQGHHTAPSVSRWARRWELSTHCSFRMCSIRWCVLSTLCINKGHTWNLLRIGVDLSPFVPKAETQSLPSLHLVET